MKSGFVGILILLGCVMGCQHDQVPADTFTLLLHRNWHLTQTQELSSDKWHSWDSGPYRTVEYVADGRLVYRRDGVLVDSECCSPMAYTFQGITIRYKGQYFCPNALCVTIKDATITQLSETLLELNDGYRIYQYVPAK